MLSARDPCSGLGHVDGRTGRDTHTTHSHPPLGSIRSGALRPQIASSRKTWVVWAHSRSTTDRKVLVVLPPESSPACRDQPKKRNDSACGPESFTIVCQNPPQLASFDRRADGRPPLFCCYPLFPGTSSGKRRTSVCTYCRIHAVREGETGQGLFALQFPAAGSGVAVWAWAPFLFPSHPESLNRTWAIEIGAIVRPFCWKILRHER